MASRVHAATRAKDWHCSSAMARAWPGQIETIDGSISAYRRAEAVSLDEYWRREAANFAESRAFDMLDHSGLTTEWYMGPRENAAWEHPRELATATIGAYLRSRGRGNDADAAHRAALTAYLAVFAAFQGAQDEEDDEGDRGEQHQDWLVRELIGAYMRAAS